MQSATSIAPWQHVCYYPIPNFQIHRLHHLCHTPKISSSPQALNYQTKTNHLHFLNNDLFPLSATTSSCSKEQENNNTNTSYPHQNHSFLEQSCSSNQTQKTQKIEDKRDKEDKVILRNMWWADLKAAVGQRINLEGISCAAGVITKDRHLVVPHVALPDIRYIDWADLKRRGFQGVVFDKDNTLTVPYSLALWGPLKSSVEECKSVFGNNIAVFSNSAGLHEYDPDGRKARALEFKIGIKVVRHRVKKPAGSAEEIETHFGCESSRLIMVGDRPFTDIVYGNRNGFLTILTNPLSPSEEPFIVRQVRKLEVALVKRWSKKGFQPTNHQLLPDSLECVKDQPSLKLVLTEGMNDNLEVVRGSDDYGDNVDNSEMEVENRRIEWESDEGRKNFIYNPQVADHLKPRVGKEFQTIDEVKDFYNAYAKEAGFSIRSWATKKIEGSDEVKRKEYVCFKQGTRITIADVETKRRRGSIKERCKAKVAVLKINSGAYVVTQFIEGHSHPLATPSKKHLLRSHRSVSSAQKCLSQQLTMINIPSHQQFNFLGVQAGGFENIGCTQQDLYNYERDRRNELKGHDGEMLSEFYKLEKGKNPAFTYEIKVDNEQRITHCFWADVISRRAYSFYGDVVVFDTTYNTNRYGMIFAPLMGVNKHGQTIIFACAFLSDETSDSFVWLFKKFLEAMPGEAPKMIITDQDPAMSKAILETLPDTFHRYCSWHILTKFSEKLDSVKYNAHYNEFANCIWKSESKEEFDLTWTELVGRSGLHDNKWLQAMYKIRSNWVPAYCNHVFSANMSSSQRAESSHAFFKRYVSKNNSLVDFMIQFSRGLVRQRQEELLADHKDLIEKPKVKMNHDFLFQMVDIYTREMFYKFEDEIWDCLNYRFELIQESDNQCVFQVYRKKVLTCRVRELIYDKELSFASCSCHKFESMGIPCRHVLGYLQKMYDYDELPQQYILKRWTKKANDMTVVDNESGIMINSDKEYLIKRSELIQCSFDVIDKALTSQEGINIYKDALAHALESINLIVDSGKSSQGGIGASVVSGKMSCNKDYVYNEPNQTRAKGCGKRLKGGKERALGKAKNSKARRCHGCGKVGQSHDKRNCPMVAHR